MDLAAVRCTGAEDTYMESAHQDVPMIPTRTVGSDVAAAAVDVENGALVPACAAGNHARPRSGDGEAANVRGHTSLPKPVRLLGHVQHARSHAFILMMRLDGLLRAWASVHGRPRVTQPCARAVDAHIEECGKRYARGSDGTVALVPATWAAPTATG